MSDIHDEMALGRVVREAQLAAMRFVHGTDPINHEVFVRELAKRVTVKEPPPKKVWSVSEETAQRCGSGLTGRPWVWTVNSAAPDIIRERPDLVAAEWERRMMPYYTKERITLERTRLFPELEP